MRRKKKSRKVRDLKERKSNKCGRIEDKIGKKERIHRKTT